MKLLRIEIFFVICLLINSTLCMYHNGDNLTLNSSCSSSSKACDQQPSLARQAATALKDGNLDQVKKLFGNKELSEEDILILCNAAQLYIPKDSSRPSRNKVIEFLKSEFPDYDKYEITIESDDDEVW